MNVISKTVLAAVISFAFGSSVFSQSFGGKGSKQFQIGIGLTEHDGWYPENAKGPKGHVDPLAGLINFQGEFGVGKYVGIGFSIGAEFSQNLSSNLGATPLLGVSYSSFWSIGVPVGGFGNFHFFQLIADKSGKEIHSDKLDIYAGLSIGSGPMFAIPKAAYPNLRSDVGFMIFGGPHAGIRFYPSSNVGFYLEVGYGKSYLNGGLAIKI